MIISSLSSFYSRLVLILVNLINQSDSCRSLIAKESVVDHFKPGVFKFLAHNISICMIATLVIWLIITIIYLPLYILSYMITSTGAHIILITGIVYLLRELGRSIAFPGCTDSMKNELSLDYIRRVFQQLSSISTGIQIFTNNILQLNSRRYSYLSEVDLRNLTGQGREVSVVV